jgi:hypothetical protein
LIHLVFFSFLSFFFPSPKVNQHSPLLHADGWCLYRKYFFIVLFFYQTNHNS